jgi:membrane protease YdiL (CAAX protease family)
LIEPEPPETGAPERSAPEDAAGAAEAPPTQAATEATTDAAVDPAVEAAREGSALFHTALAFGLVPGVSAGLALVGWSRLRAHAPRWARRLVLLASLDLLVFVAVGVATLVLAAQIAPTLGAPTLGTSGAGTVPEPLAPRPRIGVVVEDAPGGGARVTTVAPGSPASSAGVARDDVITRIDEVAIADRDALLDEIGSGAPGAARTVTLRRGAEERALTMTPVTGPFAPVPLDAARCADAMPDRERTLEALASRETLVTFGAIALVLAALFAWAHRRGLPAKESAKVLLPFVAVLFVGPTLGGLAASLACPLLVSLDVRYETIEILASEIVLTLLALGLYAAHRGLGPGLRDEGPRYGFARTLGQSVLYVAAWMPRALLLTTPLAVLVFSEGALDDAPVAELVSGAGRTPLDATLTFLAAAVLAPVAEESLFRGVLAPHLARLTGAMPAVLVTAAIFGVLHVGGHGPLFVGPMFLGAVLGWARLRSGGLAAPIALHVLLNGTAMTLALTLGLD